jgi:S-sulfosulfanyl-L-cysteine sulfohydrolase
MISRRDFLLATTAASLLPAGSVGGIGRAAAQGRLTQNDLLRFNATGNVTLLHLTDLHGQLMPLHFREPSVNIGVGTNRGIVPHITGDDYLRTFKLPPGSAEAHAHTSQH